MKKNQKIALSASLIALSVVIMLTAYFPYATYAVTALAGCVFAVITIEVGRKWAFGSYIAASVIVMLFCEKEAATLFVGFFGYYPILKGIFEQYLKGFPEKLIKQLTFNAAAVISYLVIVYVFGIPFQESGETGKWFAVALLAAGNVVFYIYDIGLSRAIGAYIYKLHPKIQRIFK